MAVQQEFFSIVTNLGLKSQLQLCRKRKGRNGRAVGALLVLSPIWVSIAAMQEKKGNMGFKTEERPHSVLASLEPRVVLASRELLYFHCHKFGFAAVQEKNQKYLFTDSLHRLGSRFARTSSVSLEKIATRNNLLGDNFICMRHDVLRNLQIIQLGIFAFYYMIDSPVLRSVISHNE